MRSFPIHKTNSNGAENHKDLDILRAIKMRGIGLSGPCKTPDFVPASVYVKSHKSSHDITSGDDTTVAESFVDFSPSPVPVSAPSSPLRKLNGGPQHIDLDVKLVRGPKGFGLRLLGGAEEGTQVK
ncbi:unnamed protein product [Rodentolepis nana]|uniref:PDZ domain-containing protein n=1 Tax=Rodentolepis nana TaxID=102285 RepID=A0A0R3TG89_RODNA|nr:unnamed protein product [Rodentolepis nana]VDO15215.1 unnamed protein product [Rodentolepis nana]